MNATIKTSINTYGFGRDWTLVVTNGERTKDFYLGQDVKFCTRVLGMSPYYIIEQIGSNDISDPDTLDKLGYFKLFDNIIIIMIIFTSITKGLQYIRYKESYSFFVQMFTQVLI